MITYVSVREARRTLADIIDAAAFQGARTVVVRHGVAAGGFVGMDDILFLKRYRPSAEDAAEVAAERAQIDVDRAQLESLAKA